MVRCALCVAFVVYLLLFVFECVFVRLLVFVLASLRASVCSLFFVICCSLFFVVVCVVSVFVRCLFGVVCVCLIVFVRVLRFVLLGVVLYCFFCV